MESRKGYKKKSGIGEISDIYEVLYEQKPHAMKLYREKYREMNCTPSKEKLLWLSGKHAIHHCFEWPNDVICNFEDEYSSGYIMPLLGKEFVPLTEILNYQFLVLFQKA